MGTAATRAKNKYNSENYDEFHFRTAKGKKVVYQKLAAKSGKSLNQYIIDLLEEQLKKTETFSLHM